MSSTTATVKLQELVFPLPSVATHVTMFVPRGNVEPPGGLHTTVTFVQLSDAVAVNVTLLALHCPASVLVTMFAGQVIVGASRSKTVTVKLQAFVSPSMSVATQMTVVVPTGNVEPLGGLHATVMPLFP